MKLTSWLQYLATLPTKRLSSNSLESLRMVATELKLIRANSRIILVAGTNGKGSVVVFLESILIAHGFRVGSYLSPHLQIYQERIRLQGKQVDDDQLVQALATVRQAAQSAQLSYFEFTTLAAMLVFQAQPLDYLVLEVGIGGRFDAVNIFSQVVLSIITTVSMDHPQILGANLELIGYEKAGIIRASGTVIVGPNMPKSVYSVASELQAEIYAWGSDFGHVIHPQLGQFDWYSRDYNLKNLPLSSLMPTNVALAIMAAYLLLGELGLRRQELEWCLKQVKLPGRIQELNYGPRKLIIDVAHNQESASFLASKLAVLRSSGKIWAIFSVLSDKDYRLIISEMLGLIDGWYLVQLETSRGAAMSKVATELTELDSRAKFEVYSNVELAWSQVLQASDYADTIVVFGSFYIAAAILKLVTNDIQEKTNGINK